jgi:hypothetical protein
MDDTMKAVSLDDTGVFTFSQGTAPGVGGSWSNKRVTRNSLSTTNTTRGTWNSARAAGASTDKENSTNIDKKAMAGGAKKVPRRASVGTTKAPRDRPKLSEKFKDSKNLKSLKSGGTAFSVDMSVCREEARKAEIEREAQRKKQVGFAVTGFVPHSTALADRHRTYVHTLGK